MYATPQIEPGPTIAVMHGGRVMYFHERARRLGVGTAEGQAVGKAITSAAAATGPAAPFVAAAGELVSLFSDFFGGGCGAACTESASLEQVPEVALDDLWACAQAGYIGQADFLNAYQGILSYGVAQLQNLEKTDSKAAGGITNLQKSTANYPSQAASLPATAPKAMDLAACQELFTNPSASGWEPGSVVAGNSLALQVLQQLGSTTSSGVSGTVTALATATGIPEWALLLGGAALVGWVFLGRG